MRDLKFRAFDKMTGKMIVTGFHIFGEYTLFNIIGQYLFETKGDRESSLERYNDVEVMQFTGLLDVDGNLIYEGDILHVIGKEHNWDATVKWNQQQAAFWLRAIPTNHYTEFMTLAQHGDGTGVWIDSARIIGNMYENPELLQNEPTKS